MVSSIIYWNHFSSHALMRNFNTSIQGSTCTHTTVVLQFPICVTQRTVPFFSLNDLYPKIDSISVYKNMGYEENVWRKLSSINKFLDLISKLALFFIWWYFPLHNKPFKRPIVLIWCSTNYLQDMLIIRRDMVQLP